jgi:hypothetical protein
MGLSSHFIINRLQVYSAAGRQSALFAVLLHWAVAVLRHEKGEVAPSRQPSGSNSEGRLPASICHIIEKLIPLKKYAFGVIIAQIEKSWRNCS